MTAAPRDLTVPGPPVASVGRRRDRSWFYVTLALGIIALNLAGFAPAIVAPSGRTVPLPLATLVLLHALAASGWMLLFLAQATLVATGRLALHRRLGVLGVVFAAAFIVTGWFASVEEARRGYDLSGDLVPKGTSMEPAVLLAPVNGLALFGVLVGAALYHRRRPDVHKRLMALAIIEISGAALAHLFGHWPALRPFAGPSGPVGLLLLLVAFVLFDRMRHGRIHPVSLWGSVAVFLWVFLFFVVIAPTAAWHSFTAWAIR